MAYEPSKELQEYWAGVIGVLEANSFESTCLNKSYCADGWTQSTSGMSTAVGSIQTRPIHVSFYTAMFAGYKLLIINPTSPLVDWLMIRKWLELHLPLTAFKENDPRKGLNYSDAGNVHNLLP